LGRDARARNVNFLLGPGVNIARSALCGRNFEYLSEDPLLNAEMVVPYIEGVQSKGVVATVKHYALNNQEFNRHNASSDVDERTMREIYLPAFEAAVIKGHVDAVMNSYNQINGVHATQNEFLNWKLLKGEWEFKGVLMSDWDATYDGVAAANNGLDLEMPNARFMNAATLLPAVKAGLVKQATIDDKVLRLLRTELRYGWTKRPQLDATVSTYSVADRAVALEGALKSITLLKNEGGVLPLDATKVRTIAVIGPNAWPAVAGGGGSSTAEAFEPVSSLTGIANLVGPNVHVLYDRGLPGAKDLFEHTKWVDGVKLETFAGDKFAGTATISKLRSVDNFKPEQWWSDEANPRRMRYTSHYKAEKAGRYLLVANATGSDAYAIRMDGKTLVDQAHGEGQSLKRVNLDLAAGQTVEVEAEYSPTSSTNRLGYGLVSEAELVTEEARKFAALADVVVVAVGYAANTESEGMDRTFELPFGQAELINTIAAINPKVVVTVTAGGAFETKSWISKVPALLDLYYPGQEGGQALAEVLLGKHNPEGRLPFSFEQQWSESPSADFYYAKPGTETKLHVEEVGQKPKDYTIEHVHYGDKLMVGYRYWTTTGKHPLFAFGHGLSYTSFAFDNLQIQSMAKRGSTVKVGFDVKNTGAVAGAEVAQLYVSDPSARAARPERELKGFAKVDLAAGETKHVVVELDPRAFSYWSDEKKMWVIDPGKFVVRVGRSSESTPLAGEIVLE